MSVPEGRPVGSSERGGARPEGSLPAATHREISPRLRENGARITAREVEGFARSGSHRKLVGDVRRRNSDLRRRRVSGRV
ncbi:hypothetical protein PR202_gb29371 [Eleusine coracana subsp. coracana]|uniref:Uncharacterized protein n=1 Tax=Eleusine coracana subsp. coracana TaxID=191504 RepID=A0AAV5FZ93_ELECO|nr:hypothetical protein PR202_gb29371 [Eleusine coracana subsp. coracana]